MTEEVLCDDCRAQTTTEKDPADIEACPVCGSFNYTVL